MQASALVGIEEAATVRAANRKARLPVERVNCHSCARGGPGNDAGGVGGSVDGETD